MRSHRFAVLALAGVLALGAPAAAQQMPAGEAATAAVPAAPPASQENGPSNAAAAQVPSTASNGLPSEPAPPRTLRAYWHVWIAFTLAWLLLFGYVVSIARRWARVERDLDSVSRGAGPV
ncbi:MAG TPA: hypothetical protein VFE05_23030 [Longimicrobiaceae bacterium]|jgi:hypothetical protein|nr:hypothetical protein [Longimicrobiaceae bacterium]